MESPLRTLYFFGIREEERLLESDELPLPETFEYTLIFCPRTTLLALMPGFHERRSFSLTLYIAAILESDSPFLSECTFKVEADVLFFETALDERSSE